MEETKLVKNLNLEEILPLQSSAAGFQLNRNISYSILVTFKNQRASLTFEPPSCVFNITKKTKVIISNEQIHHSFFIEDVIGVDSFLSLASELTDDETMERFNRHVFELTKDEIDFYYNENIQRLASLKHICE